MSFQNTDIQQLNDNIIAALSGGYNKVSNSENPSVIQNLSTDTSTILFSNPGATTRTVITQLLVTNMSETVSTIVQILEESTVIYSGVAYKQGGGFSIDFNNTPLVFQPNAIIYVKCLTPGADVTISANSFQSTN